LSSYPKLKNNCKTEAETFKKVFPVESVLYYGNGVFRVKRGSKLKGSYGPKDGRKDRKIKMLSNKSLSRLMALVLSSDVRLRTMLTLTYPKIYPKSGKQVKIDVNGVLTNLRNHGDFEYVWFLEFQKRGAPHVHILTDHDELTPIMRIRMATWWTTRLVNSGWFHEGYTMYSAKCDKCEYDTIARETQKIFAVTVHRDTWQYIRKEDGAKRYIAKYATKPEQKIVPKEFQDVGRFWGMSKGMVREDKIKTETTEEEFIEFLSQQDHPTAKFETLPTWVWDVKNV